MLARFQGAKGSTTWRKNHPHPVFSADGRRIDYNVNTGKYTQLSLPSEVRQAGFFPEFN